MKKRRLKIVGGCSAEKPFRDTAFFATLTGLVIIGVALGTFIGYTSGISDVSRTFCAVGAFFDSTEIVSFGAAFLSSLLSSGIPVLICFLLGFCLIGHPFHAAVLVYRGFMLGSSAAWIYSSYGVKGFIITLLLAVPCTIFSTFGIILSAREGIRFSNLLATLVIKGEGDFNPKEKLKLYLLKFAVIFVIILLSSLFDAALAAFAIYA